MFKNRLVRGLITLSLVPVSILVFLLILEGVSASLYAVGQFPAWATDRMAFGGRFPASFRLTPLEVALLQRPMNRLNFTALVLQKNKRVGGAGQLTAMEFYEGDKIYRVRTDVSDGVVNVKHLKGRDVNTYDHATDIFQSLKNRIDETDRKVLITIGGSTTAWSYNWPYPFAQIVEKHYPGKYLVLNMGQPGFVSWHHGRMLRGVLMSQLDRLKIRVAGLLALDGVNDTMLPTIYYLDQHYKNERAAAAGQAKRKIRVSAKQIHGEGVVLESFSENAQRLHLRGLIEFTYFAMPYTSALAWRSYKKFLESGWAEPKAAPNAQLESSGHANLGTRKSEIGEDIVALNGNAGAVTQEYFIEGIEQIIKISKERNLDLYYFLQPILVEKYYKNIGLRWDYWINDQSPIYFRPTLDFYLKINPTMGRKYNILVDNLPQYERNERLFAELARREGCCFHNITDALWDADPRIKGKYVLTKDVYSSDGIHYNADGPKIIAQRIFDIWNSSARNSEKTDSAAPTPR